MAFNPFETFSAKSRVGKSIMAIVGIVIMFTFVLSTGAMGTGNDFFDQVGGLFSSNKRGDVLAEAYGDDIRQADLNEVKNQRVAANTYMQMAMDASYMNLARTLEGDLQSSRISAETKRDLERFVSLKVNSEKDFQAYGMFLSQFQQFGPDARRLGEAMTRYRNKPESDDKKAVEAAAAIIMHDFVSLFDRIPFFIVEMGTDPQALMNFIVLQKKADQLGIKFSHAGIEALIDRDLVGRVTEKDRADILKKLREKGGLGTFANDWLLTAIGNEYRARAVLSALRGSSPTTIELRQQRSGSMASFLLYGGDAKSVPPISSTLNTLSALPGAMTPYEFWEFYKDRTSEHDFALLELSAESFLDQVKAEPTAKEVKDLFTKHRGDLPDPSREKPGFRDPRKVKVEFVALDPEAPRIVQAIPALKAASVFLCASSGVVVGDMTSAIGAASQPALAETLPLQESVAKRQEENNKSYSQLDKYIFEPTDGSIYRPQPILSLLAGFGGYPSLPGAVMPVAALFKNVQDHHVRTRAPIYLQPWLTPFTPTLANALGLPAFAYAITPPAPPNALYVAEAKAELLKDQKENLFASDLDQVQAKIFDLAKDPAPKDPAVPKDPKEPKVDKAAAAKEREAAQAAYLVAWAKERNLTVMGTKTAIDQFAVTETPELQPLNALATPETDGSGNSLSERLFAMGQSPDGRSTNAPSMKLFRPERFPRDPSPDKIQKAQHLMWLSEEVDAKTYNTILDADKKTNNEMTQRVTRAWKLEKARALALAQANVLAEQVRSIAMNAKNNPSGVDRELRDLASQHKARLFKLDNLAVLKLEPSATQARTSYTPPKIDKKDIAYPTPTFLNELMEMRKEPLGTVKVLNDVPRAKFYVAASVDRYEKSIEEFRRVFARANAAGAAQDPLYLQEGLPTERMTAIGDVIKRLRAEAGYKETDYFKDRDKKDVE